MSEERINTGKRWIGQCFEKIREEYKERVNIKAWGWKENDPAYYICLQEIEGNDDIDFIPSQSKGFTRGKVEDCGNPNPTNNYVRQCVERVIRDKFELLVRQSQ